MSTRKKPTQFARVITVNRSGRSSSLALFQQNVVVRVNQRAAVANSWKIGKQNLIRATGLRRKMYCSPGFKIISQLLAKNCKLCEGLFFLPAVNNKLAISTSSTLNMIKLIK